MVNIQSIKLYFNFQKSTDNSENEEQKSVTMSVRYLLRYHMFIHWITVFKNRIGIER